MVSKICFFFIGEIRVVLNFTPQREVEGLVDANTSQETRIVLYDGCDSIVQNVIVETIVSIRSVIVKFT